MVVAPPSALAERFQGQRHRAQARIDHPRLGLGTALGSFEDAFAEAVPGYQRRFSEYSVSDPVYAKYNSEFMNMLGYDHTDVGFVTEYGNEEADMQDSATKNAPDLAPGVAAA